MVSLQSSDNETRHVGVSQRGQVTTRARICWYADWGTHLDMQWVTLRDKMLPGAGKGKTTGTGCRTVIGFRG